MAMLRGALGAAGRPVAFLPARQDQSQTGECTCHAMSAGLYASCAARGQPLGFAPSQRALYALSGAIERAAMTPAGQALPVLQDNGRELADVVTAVASCGVKPMRDPDATRNSDATTDNCTEEPDLGDLEAADVEKLAGAHVLSVGDVATACAALDAGCALYIAFFADTAFMNLGPNDVAGPTDQNDPNGGGHAVILADWRTNAAGAVEFLLVNSWGSGWAANGCVWVSPAFFQAIWECWVLDESLLPQSRPSARSSDQP